MTTIKTTVNISQQVRQFVRAEFNPAFGQLAGRFGTNPLWVRLKDLGTELWLDTGSLDEATAMWTREFSALTTNNTLLNKEVQKGQYDDLIVSADRMLGELGVGEDEILMEIAFILNARHGLRLVEQFDAMVSVEEHTRLADNLPAAVEYARRYYAVCPERFIVKIPFTPAGLLATRILSREGIPVNHTLGFSARQNYVIARIGRPQYVNVFLGRLNSFVVDNKLGDGQYVGEKATLASQSAIRRLRQMKDVPTRQIGASFRAPMQIRDLAGLDVMTMPPKVAQDFLDLDLSPRDVTSRVAEQYDVGLDPSVDGRALGIDTLWDVDDKLVSCVDALEQENLDSFGPDDLVTFFAKHGCGDFLVNWSKSQRELSFREGKIPKVENWRDALAGGRIGLDSLMNLAGLNSFTADQQAMDVRVKDVLSKNRLKIG